MSVFTDLSRADITDLLSHYDLGDYQSHQGISAGTENTNFFVDTDRGRFVLTVFEKHAPEELPFFLALGEHLHDDKCAVPQPFRTRQGEFLLSVKNKPAVLFECVEGRHEQPTAQHARVLAEALADIHRSTARFDGQRTHSHGIDWIEHTAQELAPTMPEADQQLLTQTLNHLAGIDRTLPRGVIHADLFHDNALFRGDHLSGIIDWYFAGVDLYALDIAVCLVDWCLDDSGRFDFERCVDFIAHYHSHRPLSAAEWAALPDLTVQAATRFWLSRALAVRDNPPQDSVTIKDPDAMKALTRQSLEQRSKFAQLLEKQLS